METKELIEKQIEEAVDYVAASVRSRMSGDLNSSALFLEEACGRLLQVVQNQQAMIDGWSDSIASLQVDVDDLVNAHPYSDGNLARGDVARDAARERGRR